MLTTQVVGSNSALVTVQGDPNAAANLQSVISIADALASAGLYASLCQSVPMLFNGSTYDKQRSAAGTTGIAAVNTEGNKATFSAGIAAFTPAATATDFCSFIGSGTRVARLLRVTVSGMATAAASNDILLIKRSVANTGGTPTAMTLVPHDINNAVGTVTINTYAANPTVGAIIGNVRAERLNLGAAGAAGKIVWDFTTRNGQGLVLRAAAQVLALNWNGAAVAAGTVLTIDFEWSEEG